MTNETAHPEIGDFIAIPAWHAEGMVIETRATTWLGSDDAIEVLIEATPDDPCPVWYRLEPGTWNLD